MQGLLRAIEAATKGQVWAVRPWPWLAWMVVCLVRHQAKQEWAFERKPHLARGGLEPGWFFRICSEESLVELTGPEDERIRLPLYGGPPFLMESTAFSDEILLYKPLPWPEERMAYWLRDRYLYEQAMVELAELRILRPAAHGPHCYAPGPELQELSAPILATDFGRPRVRELWMEALGERCPGVHQSFQDWMLEPAPTRSAPRLPGKMH